MIEQPQRERMINPKNNKKGHRHPKTRKKKVENEKKGLSWIELAVCKYLVELGIDFTYSKKFPDLISPLNGSQLELDVYCRVIGVVIEVDGVHHYKRVKTDKSSMDLERRKLNDMAKTLFCMKRGWTLIRIKYDEFDNYKQIIDEKINRSYAG